MCLGHNSSVKEKVDFKRSEDVLDEVKNFIRASEAVSARIISAWKKFRVLGGVLIGNQGNDISVPIQ